MTTELEACEVKVAGTRQNGRRRREKRVRRWGGIVRKGKVKGEGEGRRLSEGKGGGERR